MLGRQLNAIHEFVDRIHLPQADDRDWLRLNASIHMLDHLQRLHERCEEEPERATQLSYAAELADEAGKTHEVVGQILEELDQDRPDAAARRAARRSEDLNAAVRGLRAAIMAAVAAGTLDVPAGTQRLEGLRWLRRVAYHAARVCEYGRELWRT